MPNVTSDDWDETAPAINDPRRAGALEIRILRKAIRERMEKEHTPMAEDTGASPTDSGGEHVAGSAMAYYQASAPTLRPDGVTILNTDDTGRVWVDSDTKQAYVWDGNSWEAQAPGALTYFEKLDATDDPTVLPFTQTTLTNGTWLVWVYGVTDNVGESDEYVLSMTVNAVARTLHIEDHPDGTAPFNIPMIVTVAANQISITAESFVYQIKGMVGILLVAS